MEEPSQRLERLRKRVSLCVFVSTALAELEKLPDQSWEDAGAAPVLSSTNVGVVEGGAGLADGQDGCSWSVVRLRDAC